MKKIIVVLAVVLFLGFGLVNISIASTGITIFYANGMFNTKSDALDSRDALEDRIRAELPEGFDIRFALSRNRQELEDITGNPIVNFAATGVGQLFEAFVQKKIDNLGAFWGG